MGIMDRTTTTAVNDIYNIRKVLQNARSKFAYTLAGTPDELEMRSGDTVKWFTVADLTEQTAALTESATFSPEAATVTSQTAQLTLYGNGVEYLETLDKTSVINLPDSLLERVGHNAGKSIDGRVKAVAVAGTSTYVANGTATASFSSNDTVDMTDFITVVSKLETNDAPKFVHPRTGEEVYLAIIHPRVKALLMKDSVFREMVRNNAADRYYRGEIGSLDGVTFIVTSGAYTSTISATATDETLVVGKGAYGISSLPLMGTGEKRIDAPTAKQYDNDAWTNEMIKQMFSVVVTPPGGHGDELAVKTAIAWKAFFTSKILNQNFMYRIRSYQAQFASIHGES